MDRLIKKRPEAGKTPESASKQLSKQVTSVTDVLLREIRGLQLAVDEILAALTKSTEKHAQALNKFMESWDPKHDASAKTISLPISKVSELLRLSKDLATAATSIPLTLNGLLLVLVSKWDAFFASLLRWLYDVHPEIINSANRSILFSDLREFKNLKDARNKVVEDEIGSVMRESHVAQFEYLEKKIGNGLAGRPGHLAIIRGDNAEKTSDCTYRREDHSPVLACLQGSGSEAGAEELSRIAIARQYGVLVGSLRLHDRSWVQVVSGSKAQASKD